MNKTASQIRHEKLIDFLNQFPQYQTNGKPRCNKVNETIGSGELESLDTNVFNTGQRLRIYRATKSCLFRWQGFVPQIFRR